MDLTEASSRFAVSTSSKYLCWITSSASWLSVWSSPIRSPIGPPRSARAPTKRPAATPISSPTTKARSAPDVIPASGAPGSNPQEAAQRDSAAQRRHGHGTGDQDRDQRNEGDGLEVLDQREVSGQGIDDGHFPEPQYGDSRGRAEQTHDEALDHERPADEPVGRPDEPHHLDLAAPGVDREPDRVAYQHQRGDEKQRADHEQDDLDRAGHRADVGGLAS